MTEDKTQPDGSTEEMFSSITENYDLLNRLITAHLYPIWLRKTVSRIPKVKGGLYLDVACGTGDAALETARSMGGNATVVGMDFSRPMIDKANGKKKRGVHYQLADAEALPYKDGTFQGVTCAFGVRNFSDRKKALREVHRVLVDDGCLVVIEPMEPDSRTLKKVYDLYAGKIMPSIAGVMADKEAYTYLWLSIKDFPSPTEFLAELEDIGFARTGKEKLFPGLAMVYYGTKTIGKTVR